MALKRDGFVGLGKDRGKVVRVWWVGNGQVRERSRVTVTGMRWRMKEQR
jgi:hypothetical protein